MENSFDKKNYCAIVDLTVDIWENIVNYLPWEDFISLFFVFRSLRDIAFQLLPQQRAKRAISIIEKFWIMFGGRLRIPKKLML